MLFIRLQPFEFRGMRTSSICFGFLLFLMVMACGDSTRKEEATQDRVVSIEHDDEIKISLEEIHAISLMELWYAAPRILESYNERAVVKVLDLDSQTRPIDIVGQKIPSLIVIAENKRNTGLKAFAVYLYDSKSSGWNATLPEHANTDLLFQIEITSEVSQLGRQSAKILLSDCDVNICASVIKN